MQKIAPYIQIARIDHWFKNVFCLPGIILAYVLTGRAISVQDLPDIVVGFVAVCLVASANYIINEILDAPTDLNHPDKSSRPIPSGKAKISVAYLEYLLVSVAGLSVAWAVNLPFFCAALALWVMGVVYNVRPIRSKELPYLDALSESVNNPIRLALGWWMIDAHSFAPLSILVSYWMLGAYFMSLKRFAEFRHIGDAERAALYRKSFKHTNETNLLISSLVYGNACCLLLGVFFTKFRVELVLSFPFIAVFLAAYFKVALRSDSPVQHPERLYREKELMIWILLTSVVLIALLMVDIPWLGEVLKVPKPSIPVSL